MAVDFEKINLITNRYDEILSTISDPGVISDTSRYLSLTKELGELEEKVGKIKEYKT